MEISPLFFYLFAGLAIGFALMVVLQKNPVISAFSLVMVFFAFAGLYAAFDAHLIAGLQVLVYAGAIMVLFVFVIMLLSADVPSLDLQKTAMPVRVGIAASVTALLGLLIFAIQKSPPSGIEKDFTPENIALAGGNTHAVAKVMFSEYILPFELTSVLLLAAIVGAVAIAKRKPSKNQQGGAN